MTDAGNFVGETAAERDSLNGRIAVLVAVLSAFLALANFYGNSVEDDKRNAQITALDTWAQYQAKRQRQFLLQALVLNAEASRSTSNAEQIDTVVGVWNEDIARYKAELSDLSDTAKAAEVEFSEATARGDLFDIANTILTIALALFAVSALTRKRALFWMAAAMAGGGLVFGLAGYFNLSSVLALISKA